MTVHQLQCLGKDLFAPLRWHEFWIGIVAGAVLGVALYEMIVLFVCE